MAIEYYLLAITLFSGVIVLAITAGPGSRLPLFPDRLFFYSLAVSLIGAALFYFLHRLDPDDQSAKTYSQALNAAARTVLSVTGCAVIYRWSARCRRRQARAKAMSHD